MRVGAYLQKPPLPDEYAVARNLKILLPRSEIVVRATQQKYLSTDHLGEEPCTPDFLTPAIELLGLEAF